MKLITFATFITVASAYSNHGSHFISPPNYGNYNPHHPAPVNPPAEAEYSHNQIAASPVWPQVYPKAPVKTPSPIINAQSAFQHNIYQQSHLNQHGYLQNNLNGYAHAGSSAAASAPAYAPPPVISPPSVSYNHNFVAPSVRNLNHGKAPLPINYPAHNIQANHYQHNRLYNPYAHVSPSKPMYWR